jgi:hypothetical protein
MEDGEPTALIVRPTSGLQQHGSGAEKVLSRIVSDALTIARRRDIADTSARIRIGKYEFRAQDYQQIVILAPEAGKTPKNLVSILEDADNYYNEEESFLVDDGAIKHLTLPDPAQFEFPQRRLQISHLPNLTKLCCSGYQLTELDLSNVPALTTLNCSINPLTELDLSNVPALTELWCRDNRLIEIDLLNVPAMTKLSCVANQLTELDLSNVPSLTSLLCLGNQLTELDLSNVPGLTTLWCDNNHLTKLGLSNAQALTQLWCDNNHLTELDLSNVPELTSLTCKKNKIRELDVRANPNLKTLVCDPGVRIIKHEWQSFSGFIETEANITDRVTVPSLSYEGKVWTIALNGEKTKLTKANEDGDSESISTMRVVVLDYAKRRGRVYYEGAYDPEKPGKPVCWSDDGVKPRDSVAEKQHATCDGCPMSIEGSKISDNGKSVTSYH